MLKIVRILPNTVLFKLLILKVLFGELFRCPKMVKKLASSFCAKSDKNTSAELLAILSVRIRLLMSWPV